MDTLNSMYHKILSHSTSTYTLIWQYFLMQETRKQAANPQGCARMCKKNPFLPNHNSLSRIITFAQSWFPCSGVIHGSDGLGKVRPVCYVKYHRCQFQQSRHCLSIMKSLWTAKCPKVNPSVPGVRKVNYRPVLGNRDCVTAN